jgi:hypothetical protein
MNCEFNIFWKHHRMFPILVVAILNSPLWAGARGLALVWRAGGNETVQHMTIQQILSMYVRICAF